MELSITRLNGWKKSIKLEKAIIRVGSSPTSDIQLESTHILPVQLQILCSQDKSSSCQVLNLGAEILLTISGAEQRLGRYGVVELHNGDEIILDGHTLGLHLPLKTGVLHSSDLISALLTLPKAVLQIGIPTIGRLVLRNVGSQACQFQVELKGLPSDCYQIDPLPMLYPGAEEEVQIQFFHRGTYPSAGSLEVTILVSAPATYPGERIIIQQGLYISPVFNQLLEIQDDMAKRTNVKFELPATPIFAEPISSVGFNARVDAQTPPVSMKGSSAGIQPLSESKASLGDKKPVKPKVVHNPSESYWDENAS